MERIPLIFLFRKHGFLFLEDLQLKIRKTVCSYSNKLLFTQLSLKV